MHTQEVRLSNGPVFEFRPAVCAVCGSDRHRPVGWRGGSAHHNGSGVRTRVVRCAECSHLYPNPMPYPALGLDDLYKAPDEYFGTHSVEEKKGGALKLLREVEARLGRRGRLLDVGCGRGEFLWVARERGWECEGVEPSSDYVRFARETLGVEARLGTIEEVRFPDGHFAAVTMGGLVEHLYDPLATLREARRVLEPGGLLWLDAPNEDGLAFRLGNLYHRARGRDWVVCMAPTFAPFHVQGFNPSSLRRLLGRAGFAVERLRVRGSMCPQTGAQTFRRRLTFQAARAANWAGNLVGGGSYMSLWARNPGGPPPGDQT